VSADRLYFEDLAVGQKYPSGALVVTAEEITEFAAKFDPQPFHLDDRAAHASLFGGLAASGWHTAALTMRLIVGSSFRPAGGIVGSGGELSWRKPVRPGDELRIVGEIVELRPSHSRPAHGLVKIVVSTFNQHDEIVQTFTPTLLVERRPG
jgi:acyl dehydratase